MDATEILSLLEQPTRNRWRFIYQIRDEATVTDVIAALRASTQPHIRAMLCYVLNLRAGAESFAGQERETRQAVPALIELLADPDHNVRDEASDALGHICDPAAGPALLAAYHQEPDDFGLRVSLAATLGFCQYTLASPTLIEALSSSNETLRFQATRGLRSLHAQEAKEPLRKALIQENNPFTLQAMQDALQEIAYPSTDEKNIERLLKLLRNARTTQEREAVANALGDIGRSALPALLILLHDSQSKIRHAATRAIAALSENRDADWFVRAYRGQVQGPLLQALSDPASNVRAGAAQALEQWGDIQAVEPLLATIQDASTKVRRAVVAALHNLKDNRALEFLLVAFFNDSDMQVRSHAAEALGRYTEDSRALNALLQALHNQQSDKRQQAAEMFCWLKDERATDALIQTLQDSSPEVREWSIEALWELCLSKNDDLSPKTIEKIREATIQARKDTYPAVRECAAKLSAWLD